VRTDIGVCSKYAAYSVGLKWLGVELLLEPAANQLQPAAANSKWLIQILQLKTTGTLYHHPVDASYYS